MLKKTLSKSLLVILLVVLPASASWGEDLGDSTHPTTWIGEVVNSLLASWAGWSIDSDSPTAGAPEAAPTASTSEDPGDPQDANSSGGDPDPDEYGPEISPWG